MTTPGDLLRRPRGKRGHAVHFPGDPSDVGWSVGGAVFWWDGAADEVDLQGRLDRTHVCGRVVRIAKPTYRQARLIRRARRYAAGG